MSTEAEATTHDIPERQSEVLKMEKGQKESLTVVGPF